MLRCKHDTIDGNVNNCYQCETDSLRAEVERLGNRDCNASVELCYVSEDYPFNKETLKIVDVGVSDNVYVVESELFAKLQERDKMLRDALENIVNNPDFTSPENMLYTAREALKEAEKWKI